MPCASIRAGESPGWAESGICGLERGPGRIASKFHELSKSYLRPGRTAGWTQFVQIRPGDRKRHSFVAAGH
jgi:hypothetical protein